MQRRQEELTESICTRECQYSKGRAFITDTHINALIVPCAPEPLLAACSAENTKTMAVQSNIPNFLPILSLIQPNAASSSAHSVALGVKDIETHRAGQ